VDLWLPTELERRFDEIAWVPGIARAVALAEEHRRPIFFFTHDGRVSIGRC
jgi:hypothetical protein